MIINETRGDIFHEEWDMLIHGVNCQGVMGSGIAKEIKERFPTAYADYKVKVDRYTTSEGPSKRLLGEIHGSWIPGNRFIFHFFTQYDYGRTGKVYVDYDAIRTCFRAFEEDFAADALGKVVVLPRIGAGLGGGDWNKIRDIINEEVLTLDLHVFYL